jgi:uncharacterized protein involved in type VI secretion and phage assembly
MTSARRDALSRETDLAFVQRTLAEEGLGWRLEEDPAAPAGHSVVIYAHSRHWPQNPTSAQPSSVNPLGGLRYHASSAVQEQDKTAA